MSDIIVAPKVRDLDERRGAGGLAAGQDAGGVAHRPA
jgi:hypothetical protein